MKASAAVQRAKLNSAAASYRGLLKRELHAPDEAVLQEGYQLGRDLLAADVGLLELVTLHHRVLAEELAAGRPGEGPRTDAGALTAAGRLLSETLGGYEMLFRGYGEANAALRGMNERLEQQIERIAHTLHDESGQLLAAIMIALDQMLAAPEPRPQPIELRRLRDLLDQVEMQLRHLAHELHPALLAHLGLRPAFEFLADGVAARSGLVVALEGEVPGRLPTAIELSFYRCVQEALNNVVRHAQARHVRICLRSGPQELEVRIADDGRGFDMGVLAHPGLGVAGMRERMRAVGGTLEVKTRPGDGTEVCLYANLLVWEGAECHCD